MAKTRKIFSNGDIIKISLQPYLTKHVYGKFIDYSKNEESYITDKTLFVFEDIKDIGNSIDNILENIICNPIRCFGSNKVLEGWEVIEKSQVLPEEYLLMDLKKNLPDESSTIDEYINERWFCASNLNPTDLSKKCRYEEVRHLESTWEIGWTGVSTRIYFEICKINKWDYSKYLYDIGTSHVYLNSFDIPIYQEIPVHTRLKFSPTGINSPSI